MNRIVICAICILCILIPLISNSQDNKRDSLKSIWADDQLPDSLRMEAFEGFIDNIIWDKNDPESALTIIDSVLEKSLTDDNKVWQALAFDMQGEYFRVNEEYDKAIEAYQKSISIREELGLTKDLSWNYRKIGLSHYYKGEYILALKYFNQFEEIALDYDLDLTYNYNEIASIYYYKGDYKRALNYYRKSLNSAKSKNDQWGIAMATNNIGAIYYYTDDFDKAIEYYNQARLKWEVLDEKEVLGSSYNNIAEAYMELGQLSKAFENIDRSIQIRKEFGENRGLAISYLTMGEILENQGKINSSRKYYMLAFDIAKELLLKNELAQSQIKIGNLFIHSNELDKAIEWCSNGLDVGTEMNSLRRKKEACECLYEANKLKGNGNEALRYHELLLIYGDSLKANESEKELQQMEFQKQVEADSILREKEKLQAELTFQAAVNREKRRRNIFIYSGIVILLVTVGLIFQVRQILKSRAIIRSEKNRSENLLHNILPEETAEELKSKGYVDARRYDLSTVLFTDFKEFTRHSEEIEPDVLVNSLDYYFREFDRIAEQNNLEKIKTIGDSYMCVGGIPTPNDKNPVEVLEAAVDILKFMNQPPPEGIEPFDIRIGVHTGPIIAGIVGVKKFQYDVWGNTVNIASMMESSSDPQRINISEDTYQYVKDKYKCVDRGEIEVKHGKKMRMYFVELKNEMP